MRFLDDPVDFGFGNDDGQQSRFAFRGGLSRVLLILNDPVLLLYRLVHRLIKAAFFRLAHRLLHFGLNHLRRNVTGYRACGGSANFMICGLVTNRATRSGQAEIGRHAAPRRAPGEAEGTAKDRERN